MQCALRIKRFTKNNVKFRYRSQISCSSNPCTTFQLWYSLGFRCSFRTGCSLALRCFLPLFRLALDRLLCTGITNNNLYEEEMRFNTNKLNALQEALHSSFGETRKQLAITQRSAKRKPHDAKTNEVQGCRASAITCRQLSVSYAEACFPWIPRIIYRYFWDYVFCGKQIPLTPLNYHTISR